MAVSWALESKVPSLTPAPQIYASDLDEMQSAPADRSYYKNLPKSFLTPTDDVGRLILHEYGALFVAREGAVPPATVRFRNEDEVQAFQASVSMSAGSIGGSRVELQKAAFQALISAIDDATKAGLTIGLPVSVLIDGKGCMLGALSGPAAWESDDAKALIRAATGAGV